MPRVMVLRLNTSATASTPRGSTSGEKAPPIAKLDRSIPNSFARARFTSRICTSMTTSAFGLSFCSTIRSMIATMLVVARTVIVLLVLFATICGATASAGMRMTPLRICASSVASVWDTKNVRMTCSSYNARFWALSGITMMVRSFRILWKSRLAAIICSSASSNVTPRSCTV